NTFFIGHFPPGLKAGKKIDNPAVKSWNNKSPLLRSMRDLQEIAVDKAVEVADVPKDASRLITTTGDVPLLLSLPRRGHTDLVLTFAIIDAEGKYNTNWPLQVSFPVFLCKVVDSLGNVQKE